MEDNLGQVKVLITPVIDQSRLDSGITDAAEKMAARFDKAFTGRGQPLGRITGKVTEFEKSMEAANARVIAFGASAGGIYLVKSAFDKLVSSTIDVEKNITNINMILGLGSSSLKTFSAEMFKAASASGQTFETASKVALEFARHGVSAAETSKRMSSAMQLMRISGLDAGESVDVLTASINSFNKEALTSADVVNRLTAVDTKFAVSAQDLAKAIERVGSTAAEAGIQFNQLLGFVTAAQTQTSRGGAVIGNAFKSIFTRLARPEVLSDLQAVGVTTKDAAGQILPMVQIMKNLASQYSHLGAAQKSFISETVGGVYQVNILKASLADLGNGITIFDKVAATAANSTGVVDKRMAQLNETISSKLNVSANQLTELFSNLGNVSFGGNMKKGLDSVNGQLDFVKRQLADFSEDDTFGQSFGKTIGRGLADAFGNILSGPGLQIGAMLLTKVVLGLGKFAIDAGKNMMGITDALKGQQGLLSSVGNFLQNHKTLLAELESGQISINKVTELYLADLGKEEAHFAAMARYQREIASLARPSLSADAFAHSKGAGASAGYVPAFAQEERDARAKGASPNVKAMFGPNIPGVGPTIINSEEVVRQNYGGSGKPAILRTYGPPGPTKLSGGLVPNFANILGTISVEGTRYQKPDGEIQNLDYPFIDLLSMIQGQYGRQILPISAKSGYEAVEKVGSPAKWNKKGYNKPGAIANYVHELSRPEMFIQESPERLRHIRSSKEVFENRFIKQIGAYNTQGFENLEFLNPVVFAAKEEGQEIYHQMQKQPLLSSADASPAIKSARNLPWYRGGKSFSPTTMVKGENIIGGPKTYGPWYEDYLQKFLGAHPDILSLIGPGMTTESQGQLNQLLRNFSKDYQGEERYFEEKYIKKSGGVVPNFALTNLGKNQKITISQSQIQSKINEAKKTGDFTKAESYLYESLTDKDPNISSSDVFGKLTKEEREAYRAGTSSSDKSNPAWAQWDVIKTGQKAADPAVGNYKSYFSTDLNSLSKINENSLELKAALKPISEKYGMDLSFKTPGTLTAATKHNDSLVVHYTNPKAASEVESTIQKFASSKGISFGSRAYTRGVDLRDPKGKEQISYGNVLAKQMTYDLATGKSLNETLSSRVKNAFASGYAPNFGKIISKGGSDLDLSEDGTLKIHYLSSSISNNVFHELLESLNAGEITKIDGGTIVGPKVPNLIHHLSKLLPKLRKNNPKIPSSIPITGYFTPNDLYRNAFKNRGGMVPHRILDSVHQKKLEELASSQGLRIVKAGRFTRFVKKEEKDNYKTVDEVNIPGQKYPSSGLFTEEDIQGIFPQATFTTKIQRDLSYSSATSRKDLTQLRAAVKVMAGPNKQNIEQRFNREYIELSKVYARGLASGYNPIADAFSRENSPTAKLGFSSRVKSPGNPGGALVYDSSYQNGPADAIRQHLMSGRPDIVNAGTPNEKIPNFAMDMSAVGSIALGAMQGIGLSDWTAKKMPAVSYGFDKMQHAVGTATEQLLSMQKRLEAGQNVKYGGQSYAPDEGLKLAAEFKKVFDQKFKGQGFQFGTSQEELKSQHESYIPYAQKMQEREQSIRSKGFAASMIAPAVGGVVSQGLQAGGYLNASKAVSALTDSATMAAQFMIAFPNKIGTALSGAVMASGVSNALNEMVYKTGTLERSFDLISTKLEKTASAVNTVNQSYDALDSALRSGSVSTGQLAALQRNLAKSYAELGGVKGGGAIVAAMKGAGTAEARATAGAEAVDTLQNEKNRSGFELQFAKQQQARSEFGVNLGNGAQGNFTPRNKQEQLENIELMRSAASNIQGEFITAQSKKGGNAELVQRMATGVVSRSDVETIKKGATETESYKKLSEKDAKVVMEELNRQLQEIAIPDDQIGAYKESLAKLKSLQIQEVYLRQSYNQSLQNKLQSGSIASSMANTKNIYGIQSKGMQEGYEYSKKEKGLGLEALYTGEQSMILKRGKEEQSHIAEQTGLKAQAVKAQGGADIGSLISGQISQFISSSLGTAEVSGKTGTVQPSEALSKATEYLGTRQKEFSGAGGAEKLFDLQKNAASPDEFAKSYLGEFKDFQAGTGGKGTEADYKTLLSQISTMSAGDVNEKMYKTLLDIQKVGEEGNTQQKESSDAMVAAIAASKFKEAAGQLGGVGILDRNTFRQQRREIRRAESRLRSRDAGVRGEGAARLLAAIPESQRDYNDPYIKKLYDTASGGIANRQARTTQGSGIGRFMASGAEAGQAAIFEKFKGTNLPIPKSVQEGLEKMKKGQGVNPEFDAALKKSAESLKLSTDAVDAFATKINSFNSAIDLGKKAGAIEQNKVEQDQVKAEMEKQKGEPPAGTAKSSEAILPITDSLITRYGQDTVRLLTGILGAMIALRVLGGKGAIGEVGAGIAAGGRKVMGGIKSIGRVFGIGAAAEGAVAAEGAIATGAATAAKGTIRVDLATQQAKALERQMAHIPESFGGPKAAGLSFGEVLPGELTHLEPTSQLKPQFKPGVPVTDAEINSALNAGRESGRQAASTSRAIAATEQAAKTASEASKAGKVLGMGAKVGKFVGGSPFLGDLVDVASIGAGALSGGGNASETMGDMMLESAQERVNKPGAHMGGDFLAGMSVRGMTSSFLAKDVNKMQEGEGGINRLENAMKMKELIKSQGGSVRNSELFSPDFRKNLTDPEWQKSHGLAPHLDKSGGVVAPTGAAIPTGDAAAKANPKSEASKTEAKPQEPQKVDVKMSAEPLHVNVTVTDENGKKIQEMQQQIVQFKQKLEEVTGNKTPATVKA